MHCYFTGTSSVDRAATLADPSAANEGCVYSIGNFNTGHNVGVTTTSGTATVGDTSSTTYNLSGFTEAKFKSVNDGGTYRYMKVP